MPVVTKSKRRVNRYAPYARAAGRVAGAALRLGAQAALRRMTQTKKKVTRKLNQNIMPVASGSSMSFYRRKYKARMVGRIHKQLSAPRVITHCTSQRLESTVGQQAVTDVAQLECNQFKDANGIFQTLVDNNTSPAQTVYVRNIQQEYLFSNASSSNVFVKIFECTARRDITASTLSAGAYAVPQWRGTGAFDHGITEILASRNAQAMGITPFDSRLFCTMYKVDKVYNVELGPGRSHKHQSKFEVNKLIHEQRTSRNDILGGITRCVLIMAYGAPVNSTTDANQVTTGRVALNIVRKQAITVSSFSPNVPMMRQLLELSTTGTYEHMDEDGDVQNEITT